MTEQTEGRLNERKDVLVTYQTYYLTALSLTDTDRTNYMLSTIHPVTHAFLSRVYLNFTLLSLKIDLFHVTLCGVQLHVVISVNLSFLTSVKNMDSDLCVTTCLSFWIM